jgi:hypothetical protein
LDLAQRAKEAVKLGRLEQNRVAPERERCSTAHSDLAGGRIIACSAAMLGPGASRPLGLERRPPPTIVSWSLSSDASRAGEGPRDAGLPCVEPRRYARTAPFVVFDGTHRTYEFLRCATPGKGHAAISVSVIEPYLTAVAEGIASSSPRGENIADAELRCYAADRMLAAVDAEQADMDAITYGRARAQAVREKDAADAALSAALDDVGGQVPEWTDVRAGRAFLKQALGDVPRQVVDG